MKLFCGLAALSAALLVTAAPASAAAVLHTFDFEATSFWDPVQPGNPGAVSGRFSVLYDEAVSTGFVDTPGVQSFSVNTSHASFAYTADQLRYQNVIFSGAGWVSKMLVIGRTSGPYNDAGQVSYDVPEFSISIGKYSYESGGAWVTELSPSLCYSQNNMAGILCTGTGGMAVSEVFASAAPEPGVWLMMIGGFGFAGAMLRSRRRAVA